jgi:hypothetical protein
MNKLLIHTFGKIKLDKNGTWYHDDAPFIHEGMAKLFHKSIIQLPDNSYALKVDNSQVPIEVEDVVSWVTDVDVYPEKSEIRLTLSNEDIVPLTSEDKLITNKDNELYVLFSDGTRSKFLRNSFNLLTKYLVEDYSGFLISAGELKLPVAEYKKK